MTNPSIARRVCPCAWGSRHGIGEVDGSGANRVFKTYV